MSEKRDEQPNETTPTHRKNVSIFAGAIIAAIALSFIILAFKSGGDKQKKPVAGKDESVVVSSNTSMEDFNKKVEQEVKRRQQMQTVQDQQDRQDPPQRGQDTAGSKGAGQGADTEKSIEEQFKEAERQRALRSRISKAKWLRAGMSRSGSEQTASAGFWESTSDEQLPESQSKIENEQAQIEQMIAQVENTMQSAGKGKTQTGPSLLSPNRTEETVSVVGRPRSEAVPEPGQRLIPTGTVVSCVLDQQTMSDYVGSFRAIVTHDVYDVTGDYVLIPKGSKITGRTVRISNVNEPIQARMGMPATWIVLPNGKRISLEKTVTLDQTGIPAVKDKVNYHLLAQFLGVAAYAMISHETSREGSGYANDMTFEGEAGEAFRSQFAPLIQKYLNLVPTITLTPGTPIKLFIEDDIYAKPWRSVYGSFVSKR